MDLAGCARSARPDARRPHDTKKARIRAITGPSSDRRRPRRRKLRTRPPPAATSIDSSWRKLEAAGLVAVAPSTAAGAAAARLLRPDRPAADGRRTRRIRRRSQRRPLRSHRRSPAGLAALRRALGPALARRRPLRRHEGLRLRRKTATTRARTRIAIGSSPASTPIGRSTSSSSPKSRPTRSGDPSCAAGHRLPHARAGGFSTTSTTSSTTASTS